MTLRSAILKCQTELVAQLLDETDPNLPDAIGRIPFSYVQDVDTAQLFLDHPKVDVNKKNKKGRNPFLLICIRADISVVKLLLSNPKINTKEPDNDGHDALWHAREAGLSDIVNLIKN